VLVPLAWLLTTVEARLDAQRRLRHEVVADRIFDELERELTSVLAQSSQQARLAPGQRPAAESWPPFVVGYVQRTKDGNQLFTRSGSGASDADRLRLAADGIVAKVGPVVTPPLAPGGLGAAAPSAIAEPVPIMRAAPGSFMSAPRPANFNGPGPASAAKIRPGQASQSDVLNKLNRAHEQRQQDVGYR
jgi:hypothetical protein